MDMIYISHPYTGNEKENKKDAAQIMRKLGKKYPDVLFINPLAVMAHLKDRISYEKVLAQCKALLAKCDGLILSGNWKDSYGCTEEYLFATSRNMPVWDNPDDFDGVDVMPKDCCGNYAACSSCHCRECVERLACWNCNECTQDCGDDYPVGYTAKGVYECPSYRREE